MMYDIMRTNGNVSWLVKSVRPTGKETIKAMGERVVDMQFTLPVYVDFKINDYILLEGETYKINLSPTVEKKAKRLYDYTIQFEHEFYDLAKIQLQGLDPKNGYLEPNFSVMGSADTIVGLIVENMNRHYSGWTVGAIDATDYKLFSFSSQNCLQVLNQLASDFGTEFWIDNKTIHLKKREQSSGLTFAYGQGQGLYNILRQNKTSTNIVTRLYVRGSSENLPIGYREYASNLLLPGGLTYIQDDAKVDLYGLIEATQTFDIKPERIGTVTSVVAGDGNWRLFSDSSMDFHLNNYKLSDAVKITFNTGQLSGYTFTLSSYNHSTKTFTINKNEEEKSFDIPSNLLRPQIGDEYVILNIQMPPAYVTNGENRLLSAGQAYYDQNSDPKFLLSYSAKCDRLFIKQNNIEVQLGNTAIINDPDMGLNIEVRIASYVRDLQDRDLYDEVEWSDTIGASELVRQYAQQQRTLKLIESSGLLNPDAVRKNIFLNRLSELNGYLMLGGNKINAGLADYATLAARATLADFALDSDKWDGRQFDDYLNQAVKTTSDVNVKSLTSTAFVSGFSGNGFQIDEAGNATFDNLTVRKQFNVFELVLNKISGTNGALAVTDTVKIHATAETETDYVCVVQTEGGTMPVPFVVGDLLRCQVFNGNSAKYYFGRVSSVAANGFTIDKASKVGSGIPAAGDVVARFGNVSNSDRQGLIYLTSSDSNSPYLDVLDGVTSDNLVDKTKVRLGKLNGINDTDLGQLGGYGLYAERAFIKGKIVVTGGNAETVTGSQDKANMALANAINTASSDASTKANVAQSNAISQASTDAQNKANAAQAAAATLSQQLVDGLKVGGRNYFAKTSLLEGSQGLVGVQHVNGMYDGWAITNGIFSVGTQGYTNSVLRISGVIDGNGDWTVSGYVRSNTFLNMVVDVCDRGNNLVEYSYNDSVNQLWKRFEVTISVDNWSESVYNFVDFSGIDWQYFLLQDLKIEQGNKATDWTPAPEDVQAAIDLAKATADTAQANYNALTANLKSLAYQDVVELAKLGTTIIDGGKIKTTLIDADYIRGNVVNAGYINTLALDAATIKSGTIDSARINASQIISNGGGATVNFVNTSINTATTQAQADATEKASAAQAAATNAAYLQAAYEREIAKAYADGIVTTEEQARIQQLAMNLQAAKDDAQQKVNAALGSANGYTDIKSQEALSQAQSYADNAATNKANAAQANAISQASNDAQAKADAAQAAANLLSQQLINGLKVGGRNYFTKGTIAYGFDGLVGVQHVNGTSPAGDHITNGIFSVGTQGYTNSVLRIAGVITSNGSWTVSGYVRSNTFLNMVVDVCDRGNTLVEYSYNDSVNQVWKRFEVTITVDNWSESVYNFVDFSGIDWQYFLLQDLKIEKGEKATDWSPAPEDVQTAIDNAKALADAANATYNALTANLKSLAYADVVELAKLGSTIIEGGKIKTTLLDADYIRANVINAGYVNSLGITATSVQATTGTIGGWSLGSDRLYSGSESANYIALISGSSPELYMKNSDQVSGEYSSINTKGMFVMSTGNYLPTSYNNPVKAVGAFKLKLDSVQNSVALYAGAPAGRAAFLCDGESIFSEIATFSGSIIMNGDFKLQTNNITISNLPTAADLGALFGANPKAVQILTSGPMAGRIVKST